MKCKWLPALASLAALTLVSPPAMADYYVIGDDFGTWNATGDSKYKMTELPGPDGTGTGVYYLKNASITSGKWWALSNGTYFIEPPTSVYSDTTWGTGADAVVGQAYEVELTSNTTQIGCKHSFRMGSTVSDATIVYDSNNGRVEVVQPDDSYTTFSIAGAYTDGATTNVMAEVGTEGWYMVQVNDYYNGSWGLKVAVGDWTMEYGSNGDALALNVPYLLNAKAYCSNLFLGSSASYETSDDAIRVRFYYHPLTNTLLAIPPKIADGSTIYLMGTEKESTWGWHDGTCTNITDEIFTTYDDGTYIYNIGELTSSASEKYFGIGIGGNRYAPDTNGDAVDELVDGVVTPIWRPMNEYSTTNDAYQITQEYQDAYIVIEPWEAKVTIQEWGGAVDPDDVIEHVYLYNKSTGLVGELTASDDGSTFTLSGLIVDNTKSGVETVDTERYYLVTTTVGGTEARWAIGTDDESVDNENYWVQISSTPIALGTGTGYFCFWDDEPYVDVTVTLNYLKDGLGYLSYSITPETTPSTYMPLTSADFAGGKKHYFYVGTRTANWRLLPEWEMKAQDDGTYKLSGRLMYPGLCGIAEVDSYANYVKHIYTLYTYNTYWITAENHADIELKDSRSATKMDAAEDGSSATDYTIDNAMLWRWNKKASTDGDLDVTGVNAVNNELMMNVAPAYLNSMVLDLSGDSPVITFDATTDRSLVADHMTFTLVGTDLKYDGRYNDAYKVTNKAYWQRMGDTGGWQDSWIQWSGAGQPYFDGYGQTIYNTAFDDVWLKAHPIFFHEATRDFYYSSRNLTFYNRDVLDLSSDAYKALYYMHPKRDPETGELTLDSDDNEQQTKIGDNQTVSNGDFKYKEHFILYYGDSKSDASIDNTCYEDTNWECFVMKDVWINGDFKIWTGWGGNRQADESIDESEWKDDDNNITVPVDARWFYENGGHAHEGWSHAVLGADPTDGGTLNVYGTGRDVNQANFMIYTTDANGNEVYASEPVYFKRIILWYDPDKGFTNSVVQLITEAYGPQIQAYRKTGTKNTLQYKWRISANNLTQAEGKTISSIQINRYVYDEESDSYELEIEDLVPGYGANTTAADWADWTDLIDDANTVAQGTYYYEVIIHYDESNDKSAESNTVTIAYAGVPVTARAEQVMDGSLYTFDVKISAQPNSSVLSMPVKKVVKNSAGETVYEEDGVTVKTEEVTVADVVKRYYVTAADTYTKGAALASGAFTVTDVALDIAYNGKAQIPAESAYYEYEIPASSTSLALPAITLKNLAANKGVAEASSRQAYKFNIYLVADDADKDSWNALAFDMATVQTDVVMPPAGITVSKMDIAALNTGMTSYGDVELMPVGASDAVMDVDGNLVASEAPVIYSLMNDLQIPVTLDIPKLSDKVTAAGWTIDYTLKLLNSSKEVVSSTTVNNSTAVVDVSGTMTHVPAVLDLTSGTTIGNHTYYELPGGYTLALNAVAKYLQASTDDDPITDEIVNTSSTTATGASGSNLAAATQADWIAPTTATLNYNDQQAYDSDGELWWIRHGNAQYKAFDSESVPSQDDCSILTNVANKDLNLYLGFYIPSSYTTPTNGEWCTSRAANGGSIVPEGGYYGQDAGLSGYSILSGDYNDTKHNWSRLAAENAIGGGYVPVQILPLVAPSTEVNTSSAIELPEAHFVWYIPCYQYSDLSFDFVPTVAAADDAEVTSGISTRSDDEELLSDAEETTTRTLTAIPLGVAAKAEGTTVYGQQTGVEAISVDADGDAAYFTLQGQSVSHPVKGQVYLKVNARGAQKVRF
ncbi:MAG: hypothetical protein LIO91_03260 [Bacteroidales bacterium]|nr:hypothetical protein [Bacteroidales bacterium]